MLRNSFAVLGALALAACSAQAAGPDFPEVAPGDISEATMKEVTKTLSSDAFEGREPGTPGEEKTLDYLVKKFAEAGLQPGNKGSWFQDVPLVEITAKDFEPLRIGGPAADMRFESGKDWVGVTYREDERTDLDDSEIVFVGFGINAPEKGWNDYEGVDMHGKTALILVNDPDYDSDELEGTFNGKAMTYYGRWTYKFEEAARQGAAAALIVHEDYPAAYGWNVVESSWSGPQAYAERSNGGADQTMVNGWVQKGVAEAIVKAAGKDFSTLSAAAKRPGFKPVALGLTASTGFDNSIRKFASKNVIGILPGSERPDEYVLNSAHWDHLGHCTPNAEGDDICNGAIDNASGTAALVEFSFGLTKLILVGTVTTMVLWPAIAQAESMVYRDVSALPSMLREFTMRLLIAVASSMTLIAAVDLLWRRFDWRRNLRMSHKDIKDEMKQTEGDPMVKRRLREIRQSRARQRMLESVPGASVVIMNPTHYAVALKYERGVDAVPVCVAKGLDLIALKIREVAEENGVPVVEEPPLARALHGSMEIGEPISREFYKAVAELISYVMNQNNTAKRR